MAIEGTRALASALPEIVENPSSQSARSKALYGAWLCGTCLGSVGMSIHHKLCHTLGGSFNLPHAETHTVVLPHAVAYNRAAVPEAMELAAAALDAEDAARALYALARALGGAHGRRLSLIDDRGKSSAELQKTKTKLSAIFINVGLAINGDGRSTD